MTTSSSVNFAMTRNEIITDALQILGVIGEDEDPTASAITSAGRALNRLTKAFENKGNHIWKRSEATLFLQANQASYVLGSGSTDHCTESFVQTTTSADEALGQTTISLTSTSGMTAGDYIGIVLDDDTLHWTTIVSVASSSVVITTALASAATSGNVVYTYTTKINKPLNISSVRRRVVSSSTDTQIDIVPYEMYQNLPSKTAAGTVTQCTYNRGIASGTLYVWNPHNNVDSVLKLTYSKPIEDFDSTSDTADLPQEWLDFLVLKLAVKLAPMYGKAGTAFYRDIKMQADEAEDAALSFDNEFTDVRLVPSTY